LIRGRTEKFIAKRRQRLGLPQGPRPVYDSQVVLQTTSGHPPFLLREVREMDANSYIRGDGLLSLRANETNDTEGNKDA
jgi:hypothetical protein